MKLVKICVIFVILLILAYWYLGKPSQIESNLVVLTEKITFQDGIEADSFLIALNNSLKYLKAQSSDKKFTFGEDVISAKEQVLALEKLHTVVTKHGISSELFELLQKEFKQYTPTKEAHFTGYYEPILKGSREKTKDYQYPIYKTPSDLVVLNFKHFPNFSEYLLPNAPKEIRGRVSGTTLLPYYDRSQIDFSNSLENKNLELLWLNDPIAIFFLHIQGSGSVELPNGEVVRVSYAEKNGQPYRPIGKLLKDEGKLDSKNITMQSIKKYLYDNPEEQQKIFAYNPSYVFFRETKEGAIGSIGQTVTGFRSIATDNNIIPAGGLAYIELKLPVFDEQGNKTSEKQTSFFVFNQDTGGAIKGNARVDLFTGTGPKAELTAGHLNTIGRIVYFAPKSTES